jgi:hypothetical protein
MAQFKLVVEFAGLCGFLTHSDGQHVGVYMPDGRKPLSGSTSDGRPMPCEDGEMLVHHVGYLRYNLADTGANVPALGREETPGFEVVRRFDREQLDFVGLSTSDIETQLALPLVPRFAPAVYPDSAIFSKSPPRELLMRSVLTGGCLGSTPDDGLWQFSNALNPGGIVYRDAFAGSTTWTVPVDADFIDVRLSPFDGSGATTVRLMPRAIPGEVHIKIANLCAENPLEWPELFLRMFNGRSDDDFKWFYQLWNHPDGFGKALKGAKFPVPELVSSHGGVTDCTGAQHAADFDTNSPLPFSSASRTREVVQ